jgi:phosphatidylserine decarboxylase
MSIAIEPAPEKYRHFNEFFTRPLKASARPVDMAGDVIVSPVDAAVSQYGQISNGRLIQAKNRDYTVEQLLGGDAELAKTFSNGEFVTLYLSPRDYHRIHMPVTGTLQSMTYVPGQLFSVSPATTRGIDNLFARNERLVQIFNTEIGSVALVMVGAIFVGSMETVWAGQVTPARERSQQTLRYPLAGQQDVRIEKGKEMGRFNMGSTVILLFQQGRMQWDTAVQNDAVVRMGQKIATVVK